MDEIPLWQGPQAWSASGKVGSLTMPSWAVSQSDDSGFPLWQLWQGVFPWSDFKNKGSTYVFSCGSDQATRSAQHSPVDSGDRPGIGLTLSISWAMVASLGASVWQLTHSLSALPWLGTYWGDTKHAGRASNTTRNPATELVAFIGLRLLSYSYSLAVAKYLDCGQSSVGLLVFL